jgi:hypothetical protein
MAHVTKRNPDRCPTHPGALLREDVIPAAGKTKAEIAQLLGISRQHLYDILRERKPVSGRCGSARLVVRRWCRSLGGHAGSLRYVARGTRRGCEPDSHAALKSRVSMARDTFAARPAKWSGCSAMPMICVIGIGSASRRRRPALRSGLIA